MNQEQPATPQRKRIVMKPHWPVPAGLHTASRLPFAEGELPSFDGATGWPSTRRR